MASLIIINPQDDADQRVVTLQKTRPIFVGRIPECDIYLRSPAVSRQHAVLIEKNGVYGIKDLGSSNGTFINGKRIETSRRLKKGDVVQIGQFTLEFLPDEPAATIIMPMPDIIAQTGVPPPSPAAPPNRERGDPSPQPPPAETSPPKRDIPPAVAEAPSGISGSASDFLLAGFAPGEQMVAPPSFAPDVGAGSDGREATSAALTSAPIPPASPVPPRESATHSVPVASPDRMDAGTAPTVLPAPGAQLASASVPNKNQRSAGPRQTRILIREKPSIAAAMDEAGDDPDDQDAQQDARDDLYAAETSRDVERSDSAEEERGKREAAATKAAAEAGLVGEFVPEAEEEAQPAAEKPSSQISVGEHLRDIIEARLSLYSFLADLAQERQNFLAGNPGSPDAVKNELARQDREAAKMPTAKQARDMIEKRAAKKKALEEKIAEAKKNGEKPPPKPSKAMRMAEKLAESQWRFIIQSEEEALKAVVAEAFRPMQNEPLVAPLSAKGVDCKLLLGGGGYLFTLEALLEEAQRNRQEVRANLALASATQNKKGRPSLFGHGGEDDEEDGESAPALDAEALAAHDQQLTNRITWINQESASLEKTLIAEFWSRYTETALAFIPAGGDMPWPVRAFLRHGAVAFRTGWMGEEVKTHIVQDCRRDYRDREARAAADLSILYADEYLEAVVNDECTPALDENLELNERNSPNWKADKALRRLIYSRTQAKRLQSMLGILDGQIDALRAESGTFDDKIAKILPGSKNEKQVKRGLQQQQQGLKVEIAKVGKIRDKINNETLAALNEAVSDSMARFESGELPRPTAEFMIRRECDAVHRIVRLLANLKERFPPVVVRDYKLGTDAMNDRAAITSEIGFMEKRDPALFLETLVPAKKRKDRIDLRISPTIVIVPSPGLLCYSWNPRSGQENGRLAVPTCFIRQRLRERQITYLLSDFRWDTSKAAAGMDVMMSETIVAAFMTVRWDWRKRSREAREKGLIYNEQNDRTNWRRVYESYIQTAFEGGKKLYNRNYDFYERIIGKYFYLPEGIDLLKK